MRPWCRSLVRRFVDSFVFGVSLLFVGFSRFRDISFVGSLVRSLLSFACDSVSRRHGFVRSLVIVLPLVMPFACPGFRIFVVLVVDRRLGFLVQWCGLTI